jgi:carbon monoxide dehydrogenase subunit G
MIIKESFEMPYEISASWEAFKNIPMLVSCMPGASLQSEPLLTDTGSTLDILFSVKLGPIVGSFLGSGEVRYDDPQRSGVFSGSGVDRKSGSRVRGEAKFTLSPSLDRLKTEVTVVVDYSLTGPLAQFSRGAIVQELAATLTREFSNNLKGNIGRLHGVNDSSVMKVEQLPNQSDSNTLNIGSLIWQVLFKKFKALFHLGSR